MEIIYSIRQAMQDFEESSGEKPDVILLSPSSFLNFYKALQKVIPALPAIGDLDRFKHNGVMVLKHNFIPEGTGYVIDLDEAEKILGYRPKL